MLTTRNKSQTGITLIELMISTALGVMLLGGAIAIYSDTVSASARSLHVSKINQDLQAIMEIMSSEIKRTGYLSTGAATGADTLVVENSGACVRYQYDINNSNSLTSADFRAFRYNSGSKSIEFKKESAGNCSGSTGWLALHNVRDIEITALTFTRNVSCYNLTQNAQNNPSCGAANNGDSLLSSYDLDIDITGNSKTETAITRTLSNTVKIRSGRYWTK